MTWTVALVCTLASVSAAAAQQAETAASDLRENDVTFEEGALDDVDLAELDRVTGDLQESGASFKIVVLGDEVSDHASADAFAAAVLDELGGDARVLVYTPSTVGLASAVDSQGEISSAKAAAIDAANRTNSFGAGVEAAAQELGVAQGEGDDSGGGGGSSAWILFLLVGLGALALVLFLWRRSKRRSEMLDATQITSAEGRVRAEVDAAANLILDLSDRADAPDAPPAAKDQFREGARLFSESQELLEEADTRPELEVAFPKVVEARWRLECAKAALAGSPEPPRPVLEPLFAPEPAPVPEAAPPPEPADRGPEPAYRGFDTSPWITAAAMAAMAALSNRGMAAPPSHQRSPMDDSDFGDIFGGLGGGGGGHGRPQTSSRRPRINLGTGRAGRGMGRRR